MASQKSKLLRQAREAMRRINKNGLSEFVLVPSDLGFCVAPRDVPKSIRAEYMDDENRYASLNSDDRVIFEQEMQELDSLLNGQLKSEAPVLYKVWEETKSNVGGGCEYPGRHLPITAIRVKNAWRYQSLRIMDKILYTTKGGFSLADMNTQIEEMAKEFVAQERQLGIKSTMKYSELKNPTMSKNYGALRELIFANTLHGATLSYEKLKGHAYPDHKPRYMAFAIDIRMTEVLAIEKEMKSIINVHFNGDNGAFHDDYPLLYILGHLRETVVDKNSDLTHKLKESVLVTVGYDPHKNSDAGKLLAKRKALQKIIDNNGLVLVHAPNEEPKAVHARKIQINRTGEWALVGSELDSKRLQLFKPSDIDLEAKPKAKANTRIEDDDMEGHIIGVSELLEPDPYEVTFTLSTPPRITSHYNSDFEGNYTQGSGPGIYKYDESIFNNIAKPDKYHKVRFKVYLNDDFFEELLRLDRLGYIKSIASGEILDLHKQYFVRKLQRERYQPLNERTAQVRIIRVPAGNEDIHFSQLYKKFKKTEE